MDIPLMVRETAGIVRSGEPVQAGIPFPQGALLSPENVRLLAPDGREVPLQASPMLRWADESIEWLLIDFQADVPSGGEAIYRLEYGEGVSGRAQPEAPIRIEETEERIRIDTGLLKLSMSRESFFLFERVEVRTDENSPWRSAVSEAGDVAVLTVDPSIHYHSLRDVRDMGVLVEERGPLHTVVRCSGAYLGGDGFESLGYIVRLHLYAGKSYTRLFYTITNLNVPKPGQPDIARVVLSLPLAGQANRACFGLEGDAFFERVLTDGQTLCLTQEGPTRKTDAPFAYTVRDREEKALARGGKAPGWVDLGDGEVGVTSAVRWPWQLHPKTFRLTSGALETEIASDQPSFRRWETRTHEMLYDFYGEGRSPEEAARRVTAFGQPLLATPPPAWMCDSGAFGALSPGDSRMFARYERMVETGLASVEERRCERREYGVRDFGDWSYDRYPDGWGNLEYDLPHGLLMQYARTGDRRYFDRAEEAAWHFMDVDLIHYSDNHELIGPPHIHSTDHTTGPSNLGHTFLEGLLDYYFLTGQRRALEAAQGIGDGCVAFARRVRVRGRQSRQMGWLLISLMGIYRGTRDAHYLEAAQRIIKQALAWQDDRGIWSHQINYCKHTPRCRGQKPFHLGIVLEGLRAYHEATGCEGTKAALVRAGDWLAEDAWSEAEGGFNYPCTGRSPDMRVLSGLGYAYQLSGHPRQLKVGLKCLDMGLRPLDQSLSTDGKGLAGLTRGVPRFLALIRRVGAWADDAPVFVGKEKKG